jgi:hypothetical protein
MKNKSLSAFNIFYSEGGQTQGNAARLAAEDHKAHSPNDFTFIDALRGAGRRADVAPELLAALKDCEEVLTSRGINGAAQQIMAARAAIAKAEAQA